MTITDQCHPLGQPSDHAMWSGPSPEASDLALVTGLAAGDPGCAVALHQRHSAAVSLLADTVGTEVVQGAWDRLEDDVRSGRPFLLPVRAHWLAAATAVGAERDHTDDVTWRAFLSLPLTAQTVLWHAEVEHDDVATVGLLIGADASVARRAVASAKGALRRSIASLHGNGQGADCDELADRVRGDDKGALTPRTVRTMSQHARHCDPCLPLVRDLCRADYNLRDILSRRVLGIHSAEYLRTRPRSGFAPAPLGDWAAVRLARRTARPSLGILGGALTAAVVVSAFVVTVPNGGPMNRPDVAGSIQLPPGADAESALPVRVSPTLLGRGPTIATVSFVTRPSRSASTSEGKTGAAAGAAGSTEGSDSTPSTPIDVTPSTPPVDEPGPDTATDPSSAPDEQPGTSPDEHTGTVPTEPAPDETSPSPDPINTPAGSVDVEPDGDSVTVTVDVPVTGQEPIVVSTPTPPVVIPGLVR